MSELKAIRSGEIYNIIEYEDCYRTDDLYYPKSEADKVIAEQKAKADKLHSCLKCLVMRDIIKDCPEKASAIEIVKEYKQ